MNKTRIKGRTNEAKDKTGKVTARESVEENIGHDGKTSKRAGRAGAVLRKINDDGSKQKK